LTILLLKILSGDKSQNSRNCESEISFFSAGKRSPKFGTEIFMRVLGHYAHGPIIMIIIIDRKFHLAAAKARHADQSWLTYSVQCEEWRVWYQSSVRPNFHLHCSTRATTQPLFCCIIKEPIYFLLNVVISVNVCRK